jgi:hypothetical protein
MDAYGCVVFGDRTIARCPYGKPGDLLYAKETWQAWERQSCEYDEYELLSQEYLRDCGYGSLAEYMEMYGKPTIAYRADTDNEGPWRSATQLPRWASRITLRITGVKVERLQEISREDAIAEGFEMPTQSKGMHPWPEDQLRTLWDSLNPKHPWESDPWVWCVTFEKIND